ncbi:hypothetical protein HDV05_008015 [Chytridiales sp. JEL 0842]|nr:hypothetical protein HDV05_008015 [Chytridiales sp. JEL 0842]
MQAQQQQQQQHDADQLNRNILMSQTDSRGLLTVSLGTDDAGRTVFANGAETPDGPAVIGMIEFPPVGFGSPSSTTGYAAGVAMVPSWIQSGQTTAEKIETLSSAAIQLQENGRVKAVSGHYGNVNKWEHHEVDSASKTRLQYLWNKWSTIVMVVLVFLSSIPPSLSAGNYWYTPFNLFVEVVAYIPAYAGRDVSLQIMNAIIRDMQVYSGARSCISSSREIYFTNCYTHNGDHFWEVKVAATFAGYTTFVSTFASHYGLVHTPASAENAAIWYQEQQKFDLCPNCQAPFCDYHSWWGYQTNVCVPLYAAGRSRTNDTADGQGDANNKTAVQTTQKSRAKKLGVISI